MAKTDRQKLEDTRRVVAQIGASADSKGIIMDYVYGDHDNDYLDALILYGWVKEIPHTHTANDFEWVGPTARFTNRDIEEINNHVERLRKRRMVRNKRARRPPKYQPPKKAKSGGTATKTKTKTKPAPKKPKKKPTIQKKIKKKNIDIDITIDINIDKEKQL